MKFSIFLCVLSTCCVAQTQLTPFEKGNGNQSPTYEEMRNFYQKLDKNHSTILQKEYGKTDSGYPLEVLFFSKDRNFNPKKSMKKAILLVNNGIHPGEPDGIDASMMLLRDLAEGRIEAPKNVLLAFVASYNIGGMLNRGSYSRANQNGPEEYGFRGNARNFDLNRDFIKADSKNARSFQEIYQELNPDVFIDNHVSNGADYQYTLTYIATNKERLGNVLGSYYHQEMNREIANQLRSKGIDPIPYVNVWNGTPDQGYEQFMDTPRYATGYTTLFNTIGTVPETHMLKPYADRVKVTYENMRSYIDYTEKHYKTIKEKRLQNLKQYTPGSTYTIGWEIDPTKVESIEFKGYEARKIKSEVSGMPRLFYDRTKPFTKNIKFYNAYRSTKDIQIPRYYLVPKSQWNVIEHLVRNNIQMTALDKDSTFVAQLYEISDYQTSKNPYEGHYNHYNTQTKASTKQIRFQKGDFLISTQQPGVKYLLETLEPEAVDSFFNWNFFDGILMRKEHFSDYVFEDTAAQLLKEDKALKTAFELEKQINPEMRKSAAMQLNWVYEHSPYFEAAYRHYPIARIL